jgi:uncharacterized protein YecE (DUF72 family)
VDTQRDTFHVGTSGYHYRHWQGVFYPEGLRKREWLAYYARHFDTVEINNTFYRLPSAETFAAWRAQVPALFCYALKFSRYGSHLKRLRAPRESVTKFLDRAAQLGTALGPILVQLPPRWDVRVERLKDFLAAAPRDYRWALEFRDPRWLRADVFALLESYNAALCIHDLIADHPRRATADWVYVRFHGGSEDGNYPDPVLAARAEEVVRYLSQGLEVFAYFNNDAHGYAVRNAMTLRQSVGGDRPRGAGPPRVR